ncbi:hypothetical protein B296_00000613 [Ensete ventricosum]|uniref:Uncharacterized protein n=1 Tax=Ensete ventricosum TaxID=4639 RepID=A0A427A8Y6_ENSVE|nr:hypothetical protein B296_00000613 [Ensete ventricosum]
MEVLGSRRKTSGKYLKELINPASISSTLKRPPLLLPRRSLRRILLGILARDGDVSQSVKSIATAAGLASGDSTAPHESIGLPRSLHKSSTKESTTQRLLRPNQKKNRNGKVSIEINSTKETRFFFEFASPQSPFLNLFDAVFVARETTRHDSKKRTTALRLREDRVFASNVDRFDVAAVGIPVVKLRDQPCEDAGVYFPSCVGGSKDDATTGRDIPLRPKQATDSLWPPTTIGLEGLAGPSWLTGEERGSCLGREQESGRVGDGTLAVGSAVSGLGEQRKPADVVGAWTSRSGQSRRGARFADASEAF